VQRAANHRREIRSRLAQASLFWFICDSSSVLLVLSKHRSQPVWRYNSFCIFAGFNRNFPAPSSRVSANTRARVNNKVGLYDTCAFIARVNVTHCSESFSKNTLPPYEPWYTITSSLGPFEAPTSSVGLGFAVGVLLCFVDNRSSSFGSLPSVVVLAVCFYHCVLPTHNNAQLSSNNRWFDQLICFVAL